MAARAKKREKPQHKRGTATALANRGAARPKGIAAGGIDPARADAAIAMAQEGVVRHQAGDLAAAEEFYRKALDIDPESPHALHYLGVLHHQRGENEQAVELIGRSIARNPNIADAHSNLGAAFFALNSLPGAAEHFRRATELQPAMAEAHSNLAAVLKQQGKIEEAVKSYQAAHRANPATPAFIKRLADLYLECSQYADAIDWFGRYLSLQPDDAEVLNNMGYAHERTANPEKAEECYRRAVSYSPDSPEINNNLANILKRLNRIDEAEAFFTRVQNFGPESWKDDANLARMYANRKQFELAHPIFENLVESRPDDHALLADYGAALSMSGRLDEAKDIFDRVIEMKPDFAEVYNFLGANRFEAYDIPAAIDAYKTALRHKPQFVECLNNLCFPLVIEQRYDEAYLYAKAAMVLDEYHPTKFVNPIRVLNELCDFDSSEEIVEIRENFDQLPSHMVAKCAITLLGFADTDEKSSKLISLHRKWGEDISKNSARNSLPPLGPRKAGSRIRIGFMSSDLRKHSVGQVMKPLFDVIDPDRFETFCYTPWDSPDDGVQNHIKEQVTDFKVVADPSARELAKVIRDDNIDILFELNGFTLYNRIEVMSYRAAPVQIFWLGYPFTIGLPEIDYILLDNLCNPPNEDGLCEKPLLMPETWVTFGELDPVPIDPALPVERNGVITFGTMNNPNKFNRSMISLWCEIMKQVPDSRFLLVRPECSSKIMCTNLVNVFEQNGIGAERLYFVDSRAQGISHLSYYDEMDITLDTYPITGGNTTVDAMWMGAPVISLVGDNLNQRLSYSLMTNVGIGDLCARSHEEYFQKAVALAEDHDLLHEIRHGLRQEYLDSPLGQTERFAENFMNLMEETARKHGLI